MVKQERIREKIKKGETEENIWENKRKKKQGKNQCQILGKGKKIHDWVEYTPLVFSSIPSRIYTPELQFYSG